MGKDDYENTRTEKANIKRKAQLQIAIANMLYKQGVLEDKIYTETVKKITYTKGGHE